MAEPGETERNRAARAEILERIRGGLADGGAVAPASPAPPPGTSAPDRVERFAARLTAYRATLRRTAPSGLRDTLAAVLAAGSDITARLVAAALTRQLGQQVVVENRPGAAGALGTAYLIGVLIAVPVGVPAAWLPAELEAVGDEPPLTARELDGLDGVLTASALAIAETGTVALDHGPGQGRRALTLLPDLHVCVVDAATVVDDVPDALAALAEPIAAGRPITLVSGPSATSDIELNRVEGVHGPRRLEVLLLEAA